MLRFADVVPQRVQDGHRPRNASPNGVCSSSSWGSILSSILSVLDIQTMTTEPPPSPPPPPAPPPFHLTERDHYVLSLTDEQFQPHSWEDLKAIIGMRF